MNYLILIISLIFSTDMDPVATDDSCGTLTSDPVQIGHNITLVYVPDKKYFNHSRQWYQYIDNQHKLLLDSEDLSSRSEKYVEVSTANDYRMIIRDPSIKDAGVYVIICLNQVVYSDSYHLYMSGDMDPVATDDSCGTLTSDPVQIRHNITLVFVPNKKYFNHSRQWYQYIDNQHKLLLDSEDLSSRSEKYVEVSTANDYRMIIRDPSIKDAGVYVIICLNQVVYSDSYHLYMSGGCATTMPTFDKHTPTDTTAETRFTQTLEDLVGSSSTESSGTHYTGENMFLIGIGIGVIIGFVVTTGLFTVILAIRKRFKMSKSRKTVSERDAVAINEGLPTKSQTESNSGYLSLRHTCEIWKNNIRTEYSQPEMTSRPNLEDDENDYEIPV